MAHPKRETNFALFFVFISILRILLAVITLPGQFGTAQDKFGQSLPAVHSLWLGTYRLDFGCLAASNHFLCANATNRTRCLRQYTNATTASKKPAKPIYAIEEYVHT